ncbi:hypothetical protein ABTY61_14995 [Kitasatospora sp. NPDC096128]|uniref:hypothetical protein n=1 Tax=Kitasatospora sp. NPDC096128 TaxID=3155547 RepID=UPI00332D02AA
MSTALLVLDCQPAVLAALPDPGARETLLRRVLPSRAHLVDTAGLPALLRAG